MKRCSDAAPAGDQSVAGRHSRGSAQISFVGAGPGAADLLTVRAVRTLAKADVVLHDSLGCQEALAFCPQAVLIPVGKRAGGASCEQSFINEALIEQAARGQHVVRLKGGDPTVFGRLDEEIVAAVDADIPYEIIPGITAASAAAAHAGLPLTQRGVARGITLVTPTVGRGETPNPDWADAASAGTTLAIYMAGNRLAKTARQLLIAGFAPDTPILIAYGVSTAAEHLSYSHLGALGLDEQFAANLPASPETAGHHRAPCLLLAGPAVADRRQLKKSDPALTAVSHSL